MIFIMTYKQHTDAIFETSKTQAVLLHVHGYACI